MGELEAERAWAKRKLEILDEQMEDMLLYDVLPLAYQTDIHPLLNLCLWKCTFRRWSRAGRKPDTCSAGVCGDYMHRSCHFIFDGSLDLTVVVIPGDVTYDTSRWLVRDWLERRVGAIGRWVVTRWLDCWYVTQETE
jgi:hypothetical protein